MDNLIFYFSGTGNCLQTAKTLAEELGNADIVSMARPEPFPLIKKYDSIGFVYPVYFTGMPKKAAGFAAGLDFSNNTDTYCYAIAGYGNFAGNGVSQLHELLRDKHQKKLNYGAKLKMFSNCVILYNMSKNIGEITRKSAEGLVPLLRAIQNRESTAVKKSKKILRWYYNKVMKTLGDADRNYTVSAACTGCGICEEVCPVKNIAIAEKKPAFKRRCEQCMACIQHCPQRAINYKNLTQKRRRYTHPEISRQELVRMNANHP